MINLWKCLVLNDSLLPSAGHNIHFHFNHMSILKCKAHKVSKCYLFELLLSKETCSLKLLCVLILVQVKKISDRDVYFFPTHRLIWVQKIVLPETSLEFNIFKDYQFSHRNNGKLEFIYWVIKIHFNTPIYFINVLSTLLTLFLNICTQKHIGAIPELTISLSHTFQANRKIILTACLV